MIAIEYIFYRSDLGRKECWVGRDR
jgi:hypothetical protein